MHFSLFLFLFSNLVIGTPLSLNQRDNSQDLWRRADTYIFPGIDPQADFSFPNNYNNNNQGLAFSPNLFNSNTLNSELAPIRPPQDTQGNPFSCTPQAESTVESVVQPRLQQACRKTQHEEGRTEQLGCYWYDVRLEMCVIEDNWRCCQDVRNGGSGCTTAVIKGTALDDLEEPEPAPGTPPWQNYIKQSFVTGSGEIWDR